MAPNFVNAYGKVDLRKRAVPDGWVHVHKLRLQPACRKMGIEYYDAMTGWGGSRKWPRPILNGVIIKASDEDLLNRYVDASKSERNKIYVEAILVNGI
jgi:hypothetical protein